MARRITIDQLLHIVDQSRIIGLDKLPIKEPEKPKVFIEQKEYKSEGKQFIYLFLLDFARKHHTKLVCEYRFTSKRKFRFDFCLPEMSIAVEYEGIFSEISRHTHFTGYNRDLVKYNLAVLCGYRLLRYSASTYKSIVAELPMLPMLSI